MNFAEFFAAYWWLMFPVFGMVMAFHGTMSSERRTRDTLKLRSARWRRRAWRSSC